jgi:hypothetical protein
VKEGEVADWLRSLFCGSPPSHMPVPLRRFSTADTTLSQDVVAVEGDGWVADVREAQVIRLFEIVAPDAEKCMLTYRATMKSEDLEGQAFLEMWCRFPGRGGFFSRGLNQVLKGTTKWSSYEIPFRLKKGECPDLVKLNLVVEGRGKIWIRDIELLKMPR